MRGQKASAPFSLWFCVPVFPLVCRATGRAWGKMPRRTWLCVSSFPMVCQTKCSRAGITVTAAPPTTAQRFGLVTLRLLATRGFAPSRTKPAPALRRLGFCPRFAPSALLATALRFGVSPHSFAVPQFPVVCPDAGCPSQPAAPSGGPSMSCASSPIGFFTTHLRHLCKPSSPGGVGGAGGIRYCLATCAATSWRKLSCSSPSARFRALTASSNLL